MPTADPLRAKALACLREGRCSVLRVVSDLDTLVPREVFAVVRSSRDEGRQYAIDLRQGQWTCTCQKGQRGETCPHLAAVVLVTTQQEIAA